MVGVKVVFCKSLALGCSQDDNMFWPNVGVWYAVIGVAPIMQLCTCII